MSLSNYSDEALQAELTRRVELKKIIETIPKQSPTPQWDHLLTYIESGLKQIVQGGDCKSWKHNIFNEVLTCIYGYQIWTFWDKYSKPQLEAEYKKQQAALDHKLNLISK